jgi:low affinity Fe/Cu permease
MPPRQPRSITRRTRHLSATSKFIYYIDHYAARSGVVVAVLFILYEAMIVGVSVGFSRVWVSIFTVGASTVTLVMVFTLQHTQSREQAATQRKLDELILATRGASSALLLLEEAPPETLATVTSNQRTARKNASFNESATSRAGY